MDIANRIKVARVARNLKIKDLADKAGLTQDQVGRMERGKAKPRIEYLQRLCDALDLSLADLFSDDFTVTL